MNVNPDLEFIRSLKTVGGDTLKKCYQCATCSVMCPLSKDGKPFPRKEMIWAGWGLKDKLMADPDVFLCHQCGDCTANCPRGAKPGDVLGAIRATAYQEYAWPKPLGKICSTAKGLPLMIGLPVIVFITMILLSMSFLSTDFMISGFHLPDQEAFAAHGYTQFFGMWEFKWYAKNIFFIAVPMVAALGIGLFSAGMGSWNLWKSMSAQAGISGDYRPSIVQFVKDFYWPAALEIISHNRFNDCGEQKSRVQAHKPLMFAFGFLAFTTCWALFRQDVLGLIWPEYHGPLPLTDLVKVGANVAGIALLYGVVKLWKNRKKMEKENGTQATFYDWFLIWIIGAVGLTGLGAEILRWMNLPLAGYIVYFTHLVSIFMLFLYLPYTKFAHIVYRTVAMTFEKYRESSFSKNPLN